MFFITGLPRSRTAWLSNLYTWGETLCLHNAIHGCPSLARYREKIDAAKGARIRVGDSDSGLLLAWQEVDEMFPGSPWVTIHRDPKQVLASLQQVPLFKGQEASSRVHYPQAVATLQDSLANLERKLKPLSIAFDGLRRPEVLARIAHHIHADFNADRAHRLRTMKVTADPTQIQLQLEAAQALFVELAHRRAPLENSQPGASL